MTAADPVFSGTLLDAVSGYLQEHADMIRFQNRLASDLSGVRGSDMNKKAVPLLRLLNKTAPGRQSTASFLPEQRTVFLLRSMQAWIADDNAPDPSPELLLELVTFFGHIAPTIQSLSGTHWPFMFDIVLEMLDAESAFAQSGSLSSCCGLLETVHELCRHNKALQEQCLTGLAEVDEKLLDLFCAGSHQSDESFLLGMYLTAHTKVSLLTEARLEKVRLHLERLLEDSYLKVFLCAAARTSRFLDSNLPRLLYQLGQAGHQECRRPSNDRNRNIGKRRGNDSAIATRFAAPNHPIKAICRCRKLYCVFHRLANGNILSCTERRSPFCGSVLKRRQFEPCFDSRPVCVYFTPTNCGNRRH